ncbi:MAG: KH domain-containing protein [Candidatus Nomurabacteria bacterium]|nr:MAG: KH domain-containing protein [Candidatus Nomurabacteria bacterium]
MAEQHSDQEFVEFVVKSIVDRPEDVTTERTVDEMGVLITLKVNPQDLGQVIGRNGQTAKSVRTLLRVVGAKNHARVNLKIFEPEGFRKSDRMRQAPSHEEDSAPMAEDTSAVDDLKL